MKLGMKIGDTVEVVKGKFAGQKSKITKLDKRSGRVVLEKLKKEKTKAKELHGSFHASSLQLVKVEAPKKEDAKTEEVKADATQETKTEVKAEEKVEAIKE